MCPKCSEQIALWDNIPLVSFILLRGKCRKCHTGISVRYPLVELVSALLFASTMLVTNLWTIQFLLGLCLWLLFCIAIIDARVQGVPDLLNIPLVVLALSYALLSKQFDWLSVVVGVGFLGAQWVVSLGRWIGSGDLILIAGISLLVGAWPYMVICLFIAYILGAAIAAVLLMLGRKKRCDALAFAPFLVLSTFITIHFGEAILVRLF